MQAGGPLHRYLVRDDRLAIDRRIRDDRVVADVAAEIRERDGAAEALEDHRLHALAPDTITVTGMPIGTVVCGNVMLKCSTVPCGAIVGSSTGAMTSDGFGASCAAFGHVPSALLSR